MGPEINIMKITAQLTFHYQNNNMANVVSKSLNPDNAGFVESKVEDNLMICEIKGESLNSILSTIDDLIFSEIVVENVLNMDEGER
jgi:hypothetical protein